MNATQQKHWWLTFHRFQQSREATWQSKLYKAIQNQIKSVTAVLKDSGYQAAISRTDTLIKYDELSVIIKNIYIDAGTVFGGKAYQLTRQQVPKKLSQKAMMPIGYNEELVNEIIQYFQLHLLNEAVIPISDTTKDYILRTLIKAEREGRNISDAVKEIETTDITKNRARLIARTETVKAANFGAVQSAKKTGYETNKIWISGQDMRTRRVPRDEADHLHANGQTVPLSQPFKIRDMKSGGYVDMMYPGDPNGGAENVCNCRCTVSFSVVADADGVPLRP